MSPKRELQSGLTPTVASDDPLPRGVPEDFTPPRPEALFTKIRLGVAGQA